MPTSYRFEISPNNRAGCQNKECKDAGLKIAKGQLRFGTWVEYGLGEREFQGWKWRHWSCITPTVIQNLLKALGGLDGIEEDLNVIDGYEDMPTGWQEKILTMLREGHIPDEDWKGDAEQNRPGKRGSHKKATTSKKAANGDENDEVEDTPTKAKAKAKKGRRQKGAAEADQDDNADETSTQPKAAKGRGKTVTAKATDDVEHVKPERMATTVARSRGRGKKAKAETDGDDDGDNALRGGRPQVPEALQKESKNQKKRKAGHLALSELDNNDEPVPPEKPTKKSSKKIKVETTLEGPTVGAKKNGVGVPAGRATEKTRGKKASAGEKQASNDLGGADTLPVPSKKAVKAEQLDGAADLPAEAGGHSQPTARRGIPRKGPKVEDEADGMGDLAELPAETEEAVAPSEPEKAAKPNVKASKKKGMAKGIAKPRIKPEY